MRLSAFATTALLALVTIAATSGDNRFVVKVGPCGPRTEVRVARPTLQWQIWAADETSKVTAVDLKLDGKRVNAQYDSHARSVKYTPGSPLEPGPHRIECRISFEGGAYFDKQWETRVAEAAISDFPDPIESQLEAVKATNDLRRVLGLAPVQQDDRLDYAAMLHSSYLAANKLTGHGEKPGTPGFLAETGSERIEIFGFTGNSWEDVNFGSRSVTESVQELFSAPYHRLPFMQPGDIQFGSGYFDQRTTIEFGMSSDEGTVISPANGQTNVPTGWHNFERPNPLRIHGVNIALTGYPIVFAHFEADMARIRAVTATLTGPTGEDVPCWLNSPDNDPELSVAAFLIPERPLKPGVRYQASFSAIDNDGHPLERTTRFTTAPLAPLKRR